MNFCAKKPMVALSLALCLAVGATSSAALAHKQPKHRLAQASARADADQAIVERTCRSCHDLNIVARAQHTPEEWPNIVKRMRSHGADISDDNFDIIVRYLANKKPGAV